MRPTGGMRQKLGHKQAGLRDVLVPVRARLGIALLGLKVDVEQAITLVVAVGPGELVLQRPHKVTVDVYAAVDCLEDPREMLTHVVDTRGVIDKAILEVVLIAHAVLGDVDLLVVGVIVLNAEQQVVEALGIDDPVPIGGGYAFAHACLAHALEEPARGALVAGAIVVDVVFALGGTQELALVGVDAQAIVVGAVSYTHLTLPTIA